MLEFILDKHVIYVLMGMSAFVGVAAKAVAGRTLRKLLAAAESMGKSNHPLMRLVRAKFEHTCMISEKVENVGVFVDKYLYEYRVLGVRLHTWQRLQMAGAGLCLILGGVGAAVSYRIKGATEHTAMIGGTGAALALIVFLVHMLTDEEYRLDAVRNYMVDYLENIYQHRYEKNNRKEVRAEAETAERNAVRAEDADGVIMREAAERNAARAENADRGVMRESADRSAVRAENADRGAVGAEAEHGGQRVGAVGQAGGEYASAVYERRPGVDSGLVRTSAVGADMVRPENMNPVRRGAEAAGQDLSTESPEPDSLIWAMYKTEPLQVEDERKVKAPAPLKAAEKNVGKQKDKALAKQEKPGKMEASSKPEKTEKTQEAAERKVQDEAGRNQRIREILEEFMA